MTTTELRSIIADIANQEWFANIHVDFNYSLIGQNSSFKGISAIYEYVNQQVLGWEKFDKLPNELSQSKAYFTNIKLAIIQFVNRFKSNAEFNTLNACWQNDIWRLISNSNLKPLPYDIPQIEFLLKVFQETPDYFQSAYNFLFGIKSSNTSLNREILYGGILAYEFMLKDHINITERRNSEKKSISELKAAFQEYLSNSETQLTEHLRIANTKYKEYAGKIDDIKTDKENIFNSWLETSQKKTEELEKTYQEKLKLEEPAKYWDARAKKLKIQGWITLGVGVLLVVGICVFLGVILIKTPDAIYASWFGSDKSAAIKWTLVYITLLSFIAFGIRALLKVMFSSFHLARDCEERYTLTYFYLSLLKDSKVDEKDRQLIMQSLFSRAETGLLKDDSSPTMPNDVIGKFMSK